MTLSNRIRQRALSSAPFRAPNTWDFSSSELIELLKEDNNEDEDKEMKEDQAWWKSNKDVQSTFGGGID